MLRISSFAEELSRLPDKTDCILGKSSKFENIFTRAIMTPTPEPDDMMETGQIGIDFNVPARTTEQKPTEMNCWTFSLLTFIVIVGICTLLILLRDHIKELLLWIELQDIWLTFGIFLALFTFVSFPFTWGYVLLNVAAGYLFGLILGLTIVVLSAGYGIFVSHIFLRRFCAGFVKSKLHFESMNAVLKVVEGKQGLKVVALTRLTPIPFGLQNALFAVTNVPLPKYLASSMTGLMPTQVLNSYIGSTLRSIEDIFSEETNAMTGYIIFTIQLLLTVFLMLFVIRRARTELNKAVQEDAISNSNLVVTLRTNSESRYENNNERNCLPNTDSHHIEIIKHKNDVEMI